jgi:hypothetical protein
MMQARSAIAVLIVSALWAVPASAGDPMVVVQEQRAEEDLSPWRVRLLSSGEEPLWENGDRVRLLLPPEDSGETLDRFHEFLDRSPFELRKIWVDKVFKGEAVALPLRPQTVDDLLQELLADPGGLAILPADAFASGVPDGLKVLSVGGKRAGDVGYALAAGL